MGRVDPLKGRGTLGAMRSEMEPETPGSVLAGQVVAKGIGAGAGLLIAGPVGAVVGAMVTPVLERIIHEGNRRSAENVYRLIAEAADVADVSADRMAEMLDEDDRYLAISASAVQAALTNLNEQKVTALARALGDGLRDEAKLDMSWLIVLALTDLETPQVRALARFAEYPTDLELEDEYPGDALAVSESPLRKDRMRFSRSLPAPILSTLVRHGLVSQTAGWDGTFVEGITDFGRDVLRYLEQNAAPSAEADGAAGVEQGRATVQENARGEV